MKVEVRYLGHIKINHEDKRSETVDALAIFPVIDISYIVFREDEVIMTVLGDFVLQETSPGEYSLRRK